MDRRSFIAAGLALAAGSAHAQGAIPEAFRYHRDHNGAALIVSRSGVARLEHFTGSPGRTFDLGAITRIFAPVLAGALASDGLLSLDEPAAMTLGDWGAHPIKSTITLRQVLNGTSGLAPQTPGQDLASLIAAEPAAAPGQAFSDDPALYRLFVEIARRKLEANGQSGDVRAYVQARFLSFIGAMPASLATLGGEPLRLDDGAAMSARALWLVGEALQRMGVWRARPLLEQATIAAAFQGSFAQPRRGIGLWLAASSRTAPLDGVETDVWSLANRLPIDFAMAAGAHGARLYLIPSERTVIVRLGAEGASAWSDAAFLGAVLGRL